ncbi:hypothetical protein SDC9_05420 [bioreactor metagenome]|uniref:Uncharacterized protein n=1 Tax=bioreactor metagenome TaxID=1076179 RepID=A0A644SZ62_9ZZZZ
MGFEVGEESPPSLAFYQPCHVNILGDLVLEKRIPAEARQEAAFKQHGLADGMGDSGAP